MDKIYTDFSGTWITIDGWTTRIRNGRPYFITCSFCEAPVNKVHDNSGCCIECYEEV